jgi:peptidoglycan/xylan/chitin deacetylase (PgdA/CDA1 family)
MSGSSGAERAIVLMYHRVGAAHNDWERKYCVSPQRFADHMRQLRRKGYRACGIDEFVRWLAGDGALPDGSFLLTFDDGFLGVHEHAWPVLASLGWPATVFLVSGLIGRQDDWTRHENPSGRTHPLLDRQHIAEMARHGFGFHSHSRHHADLPTLGDEQLADELAGARRDLEDLLGTAVPYLAYPYGRYDERVRQAAIDAGYAAAFSVQPGFNRPGLDPYRIRRLDVYGTDTAAALARKMALGTNDGSVAHTARYAVGRAAARLGLRDR